MSSFSIAGPINIEDVRKAPDSPGLYVWYARFRVGRADWHENFAGDTATAKSNLFNALGSHSLKFAKQGIAVKAVANFSTQWSGLLQDEATSRWKDGFQTGQTRDSGQTLDGVCSENATRQALVHLLDGSFPIFNAPLYIGLAVEQSLKDRLTQHSTSFLRMWHRSAQTRGDADADGVPTNFAERAFRSGFCPDDLFCYAITLERDSDDQLSADQAQDVIIAAEWVLNRWAIPILGRQ